MSQTSPETSSLSKYQAIFDHALEAYEKKTREDLTSHPLLASLGRLETCQSPDAILDVLRQQIFGPGQHQSGGDKLLTWLNPTIKAVNALSTTIGGGVGLVGFKTFWVTCPGSAA
jgi:hypothetical protein